MTQIKRIKMIKKLLHELNANRKVTQSFAKELKFKNKINDSRILEEYYLRTKIDDLRFRRKK